MKQLILISSLFFIILQGCKKDTGFTEELKIPQELMDYFVNYDPGTCWVYQDSIHTDIYDTIELVDKFPVSDVNDGASFLQADEILWKGYMMSYHSKFVGDFDMRIKTSNNKTFDLKVTDPYDVASYTYDGDNWDWGRYQDSVKINQKMYYHTLILLGGTGELSYPIFSRKIGIISFIHHGGLSEFFKFVKTFRK
jgi:hypothetical protein